jgi:hypothetical protein
MFHAVGCSGLSRRSQFHKRSQQFTSVRNETRSVVAMNIYNPYYSPSLVTAETQPQLQPALLSLSAMISQYFTNPASLVDVLNHLRCRFAQFNLCADFLQASCKRFNLLLQARNSLGTCQPFLSGLISMIVTAEIAFFSNRRYLFA